jgi:hypothetical protein
VWVAAGDATTAYVQAARAPNSTFVQLPGGVPRAVGARFVGLPPTRVVDSRSGLGVGALPSGAARTLAIAGHGGVPANATAITGTITVVGQTSRGFLSLGPSTATLARSSVLNVPVGDNRAVGFTVALDPAGQVAVLWTGAPASRANVLVDVTGYYVPGSAGSTFAALVPARVLDTRDGTGLAGPFASGAPRTFAVVGRGGVPAGATAVTGNLLAIGPTSSGYLSLAPGISATPATSTLNVPRGDVRAASITLPLDGSGRLGLVWKGTAGSRTNVVFDVTGYFAADSGGATFFPIDPARVLDTRSANGLAGPFATRVVRTLQATGRGTVPVDAVAVTGGVVAVAPTGPGWLGLAPAAPFRTSAVNVPKGDVRANGFTTRAGTNGLLAMGFYGPTGTKADVIVDVTGYFR